MEHKNTPFLFLHKFKFDQGTDALMPVSPEGTGDAYYSDDIDTLNISNLAGNAWLSYDLTAVVGADGWKSATSSRLSGFASSIDYNGVDQSYHELLLMLHLRCTANLTSDTLRIRFNSDSGTNYHLACKYKNSANSSMSSHEVSVAQTSINIPFAVDASHSSINDAAFGAALIWIQGYTDSMHKMVRFITGHFGTDVASNQELVAGHGIWLNTAAITQVVIDLPSGSIDIGSSYTILYRGAETP